MPFFVRQKVQISSKMLPQIPNFGGFSPSENEALSAAYNCYCCKFILWSLVKTVRGFWLLLFSRKKTGDYCYWVSWTVALFVWYHTVSWQIINHYILECHMVKLSLDLRQIMSPKCHFSFVNKCKFRQKFCHKSRISPISSNFVKNQYFRHYGRPIFVTSSVFRQKRNHLEIGA